MLEELLSIYKSTSGGPWNGVLPVQDANTLFRMHTFSTTADIRDKGPNAIPVTNTGITVGSDSHGTYMKFNGTGTFLSFTSSLLNGNSYDITLIMGDLNYPGTSSLYGVTVLDGRPNSTNGRYLSFGYDRSSPFISNLSFQSSGSASTVSVPLANFPAVLVVKVRPTGFTVLANGVIVHTWNLSDTAMTDNAQWRVGRNAFVSSAAVPYYSGKIYYMDFKKVV